MEIPASSNVFLGQHTSWADEVGAGMGVGGGEETMAT